MVLEMAMRGRGQIAELCRIAEPEIGVITNIGPVHLELLGTLEAIAEAKAELLVGLSERWPGRGAGGRGGPGAPHPRQPGDDHVRCRAATSSH